MYVCICHALREKDVRRVVNDGETSIVKVYQSLGCKPRCGKCLGMVAEIVAAGSRDGTQQGGA